MENAAILHTSWQRPPLLMDPYLSGVEWYAAMLCHDKRIVPVNLSPKTGQSQIMVMEKAIISGITITTVMVTKLLHVILHRPHTNVDGL